MFNFLRKSFPEKILPIFLFVWILTWHHFNWADIKRTLPYYSIAVKSTIEEIREMCCVYDPETVDYYRILKFCDKVIPAGKKVRLILPEASPHKHNFLMGKGRYYLYPRYYGNKDEQADYILFYNAGDALVPGNYAKCVEFGKNKYLLAANCRSLKIED